MDFVHRRMEIIVMYIGADFPDECAHSKDTKELRGANMYAKANSSGIMREMIEIFCNPCL